MADYSGREDKRVSGNVPGSRFLTGTSIEVVTGVKPGSSPRHVFFDFDGTLSLIREGWTDVMVPMMVEVLQETGTKESESELYETAYGFVMELTGKQTVYQMIRLAEEVKKRGGVPRDPLEYKNAYHGRLMERIRSRREDLRSGRASPRDYVVPGAFEFLDALLEREVSLYVASGTDQKYVKEEVELLKLDSYFQNAVYGAIDDYKSYSKARVIKRILEENRVKGSTLLGFGDGYVEIENVKEAGGTAVAVASDEANRSGNPDPWKRERLLAVGADMVIPDFREYRELVKYFWIERGGS